MEEILEKILGLQVIKITKVEEIESTYHIYCESKEAVGLCPNCGKLITSTPKDSNIRHIRDLSIIDKKVILHLTTKQYVCKDCNRHFYERFWFVESGSEMTIRLEDFLYRMVHGADLTYVANKYEIGWKTINRLFHKYSTREISAHIERSEQAVTQIAMDEIALHKGHRDFVVVIIDLVHKVIIDILENREKASLIAYFQGKGLGFCNKIKVFCSDMWDGYLNTAKEVFPNAAIVVDRFHFFSYCNAAIETARKYYKKELKEQVEDLRGLRFTLLKNTDKLSAEEQAQLDKIFEQEKYLDLKKTYDARNDFRAILEQKITSQQAHILFQKWLNDHKGNRFFFKFIKTFNNYYNYILNYFDYRVTTSVLEGFNNKLKMIKRRAFGFLNFDSFRAKAFIDFF
jgi:transposase